MPPMTPDDQRWFQHPEMQARIAEAEAEADLREGRITRTATPEEAQTLLDSLKSPRPEPGHRDR